jgi:hypothetical protein
MDDLGGYPIRTFHHRRLGEATGAMQDPEDQAR